MSPGLSLDQRALGESQILAFYNKAGQIRYDDLRQYFASRGEWNAALACEIWR